MVENIKTLKDKYLSYAVVILIALVVILLLFKKETFNKLLFVIAMVAVVLFFFLKKPKGIDIYKAAREIQLKHYKITAEMLDISDIEADEVPPGSNRLLITFKKNSKTFTYHQSLILGVQIRELYNVRYDMEKSRLVEHVAKTQNFRQQLEESAKKLGIDPGTLGGLNEE